MEWRSGARVATAAFAVCVWTAAAAPEVVSRGSVPMGEVAVLHPCTRETLRFGGALGTETGVTPGTARTSVRLRVDARGAPAAVPATGASYSSGDTVETRLELGPAPVSGAAVVTPRYSGAGGGEFRAAILLNVSVAGSGTAEVTLGPVAVVCP